MKWSRLGMALMVAGVVGMPLSGSAQEGDSGPVPPVEPKPLPKSSQEAEEALNQAGQHLLDALEALGNAGRLTYDKHAPALNERSRRMLDNLKELLGDWEERLQQQQQKPLPKPSPEPTPDDDPRNIRGGGSYI
ncbi:MAG: hypothetical protein HQL52_09825 [Magnetococcales bacterium]|nr:hypothetical protein [Magnetococcales bacterium]